MSEDVNGAAVNTAKRTRVPLFSAFFMIYIFVSGGSFGIEEMVASSGPGLTLLLLMVLPIIWALPMALIASELGSAIPDGGGFYVWTRRGLGPILGFSGRVVVVPRPTRRHLALYRAQRHLPTKPNRL